MPQTSLAGAKKANKPVVFEEFGVLGLGMSAGISLVRVLLTGS